MYVMLMSLNCHSTAKSIRAKSLREKKIGLLYIQAMYSLPILPLSSYSYLSRWRSKNSKSIISAYIEIR